MRDAEMSEERPQRHARALPAVMRAAVIVAPGRIVVEEVRVAAPGPGEILVRLQGTGLCASNLPVWEGREWFSFRRCDIQAGQTVAVIGVGFLGALLTELAVHAGARVIAISRRPYALRLARELGAAEVLRLEDPAGAVKEVEALTGAEGCDRVIEAVGEQRALDLAGPLTRERGRLIIAGYHQDGPRRVDLQLWNWRGLDVINAHERDPRVYADGVRRAVDAVASGQIDLARLLTHTFPLESLHQAFETLRSRPDGFLKALVRP